MQAGRASIRTSSIRRMDLEQRFLSRADLVASGLERPDRAPTEVLERVRRGIYVRSPGAALAGAERYRRQVLAAARTITGTRIFSHESAAVLLGLPILGAWPEEVHLIDRRRSGGRSQLDVVRHCLGLEAVDPVLVDGLLVTSPARTAFDLAVLRPFPTAVVTADAVLRGDPGARAEFERFLEQQAGRPGRWRARRALGFADPAAESVGESLSRVLIHQLGFATPVLQFPVETDGRLEFTDFGWPEARAVGEFDGEVKYREDRYRRGGTAEDVVVREKNRENRIRRSAPRFARWDWRDLRAPGRLEVVLDDAGIPRRRAD